MSPTTPQLTTVLCPNCNAAKVSWREDATYHREVLGLLPDGRISLTWCERLNPTGEGHHQRMHCDACEHEWQHPGGYEI